MFFFNDTATTEIYTLSLHDALPISAGGVQRGAAAHGHPAARRRPHPLRRNQRAGLHHGQRARHGRRAADRKSTRLNSSHANISYAVFCLKKKTTYFSRAHPLLRLTP